jgi:hypothetical protein
MLLPGPRGKGGDDGAEMFLTSDVHMHVCAPMMEVGRVTVQWGWWRASGMCQGLMAWPGGG